MKQNKPIFFHQSHEDWCVWKECDDWISFKTVQCRWFCRMNSIKHSNALKLQCVECIPHFNCPSSISRTFLRFNCIRNSVTLESLELVFSYDAFIPFDLTMYCFWSVRRRNEFRITQIILAMFTWYASCFGECLLKIVLFSYGRFAYFVFFSLSLQIIINAQTYTNRWSMDFVTAPGRN